MQLFSLSHQGEKRSQSKDNQVDPNRLHDGQTHDAGEHDQIVLERTGTSKGIRMIYLGERNTGSSETRKSCIFHFAFLSMLSGFDPQ